RAAQLPAQLQRQTCYNIRARYPQRDRPRAIPVENRSRVTAVPKDLAVSVIYCTASCSVAAQRSRDAHGSDVNTTRRAWSRARVQTRGPLVGSGDAGLR